MFKLYLKPKVLKFIRYLPAKHQRQIKDRILLLQSDPMPNDAKSLIGYEHYIRIDIGEYRIIYRFEKKINTVTIILVGKRNDNEVYRIAKRNLK